MRSFPWKSTVPVLAALAMFYALSLAYFSPVLEGKRLDQHDIRQWQGMAQEVEEHREETGEEALWTGSMFSGMPAYQISVIWSANLLSLADSVFHGFLPRPANFLFLYLTGMFVLLRILRVDPWLSVVGAVAFAFSSYFFVILPAGHTSKANAIGYMPMVLGGVYLLYRGRMLLGAALLALFLGLEIMVNHVQVTYYLAILLVLFVLAEGVRAFREGALAGFLKRSGLGAVAVCLALLCNMGMLWSTLEYGKYSTRGKSELSIRADGTSAAGIATGGLDREYVTRYSYGKQESFTLLVPDAKGGATGAIGTDPGDLARADQRFRSNISQMNRYWGDQYSTSGPQYAGAIVVLLMFLMLMQAEGRGRWWLLASGVLIMALIAISNKAPFSEEGIAYVAGMKASLLSGILLIAYLLVGLLMMRDALVYALFSALLVTLLLSWGRNLMPLTDFFLEYVPGYNKFRAVTIILVIVELAAPVLGILYLDRLIRSGGWSKVMERRSLIGIGVVAGLLLVMALVPDTLFNFISDQERASFTEQAESSAEMEGMVVQFVDALKSVRIGMFTADVWRSFAFVVAAAVLVFLFGRKKVGKVVLVAGIGTLVLLDQWVVDKRYMHNEKERGRLVQWVDEAAYETPYQPNESDKAILAAEWSPAAEVDHAQVMARLKERKAGERGRNKVLRAEEELAAKFISLRKHAHYRVLDLGNPFNDTRASYFHRSLGGYHGAKLKRYQDLIEFHISPAVQRVGAMLRSGTSIQAMDSLLADEGVLNMLNTRYLVYSPDRAPIRNTNTYGDAWFVDEVRWAKDADEEITLLGAIDPAGTAVVDERYRTALDGSVRKDPSASAELSKYRTNELTYTVRSAQGGVVVFSEIWYGPDWKATVDGVPAEHVRADYALRAMAVPAGEHTIVFKIESRPYNVSRPFALASSGIVLLLVIGALGMELRRALSAEVDAA
ncbi:MAG: hypothetical protein KDB84_07820 [Flavobacteriales bacterium]|nr:hypothetical protein [Flavobacteriales bacterium]